MIVDAILAKIFGTKNEREIKAMLPLVQAINDLEPKMKDLSDIDLAAKTIEFKEKLAQGATLDDLLTEAFAVVREAGRRLLAGAPTLAAVGPIEGLPALGRVADLLLS